MAETRILEFDFAVGEATFHVAAELPIAPVRARRVLPVFQGMADQIVGAAAAAAEAGGAKVSCKAGCGACCRQVVPISGAEVRRLRELVGAMAEPRRSVVRARFAEALGRLKEAGILEIARDPGVLPDEQDAAFARRYMQLAIPCPFLEDESCSIHADCPAICREYLVTSPAERCSDPQPGQVQPVLMAARISRGLVAMESKGERPVLVPMVTALEWAERNERSEPPARPAMDWITVVMQRVAPPDDAS